MTKLKQLTIRFLKWINPLDIFRYYINKIKQHKVLFVIITIFTLFQTAYCVNFSPLARFWTNGGIIFDAILAELEVDLSTGTLGGYAENLYDVLAPVGQAMAVLMWVLSLGEISMRDDLTPEFLIKDMIKVVVLLIVIGNYGWDIIVGATDLCNEIFTMIQGAVTAPTFNTGAMSAGSTNLFSDVPWTKIGTALLSLGLLCGLKLFLNISIAVTIWERKLKIMVYAAAAPLGLYDFREGFHSHAANYIKKYASFLLQGALILLTDFFAILLINTLLAGAFAVGTNIFDSIMTFIKIAPLMMVLASFMKTTEHIAADIIGAH